MTCTTTEIEITNHKWVQKNNDKKWAQYHITQYANHIAQFKNWFFKKEIGHVSELLNPFMPTHEKKRLRILGN